MSNWRAQMEAQGVDDLTLLSSINEKSIVENLRKRYGVDQIFTYIGPVLISVNPYKFLPCCSPDLIPQYRGKNRLEMPPNIFALADDTYRTMLTEAENQCVIISGESGAGKTEASKLIMKYIAAVSGSSAGVEQVKDVILQSNPLLEAFGNAKTVRNNNSSRFGKYFEIQFNAMGDPDGGRITNYLLEKSRVTFQNEGERNFHVFYQMLAGASQQEREYYQLYRPSDYAFLNQSGTFTVDGMDDVKEYQDMRNAMNVIGIPSANQGAIMQCLSAILHMGNMDFYEEGNEARPSDPNQMALVAQMLEVDPQYFQQKMLYRLMQSGIGNRASVYNVPLNRDKAIYARNAIAQILYSRVFDYLVQAVNAAMTKQQESLVISVLDIYGFEIFRKNGFEQFCINYVNEKLQQIFIELTLKAEQEEYNAEGIQWTPIEFFNNKVVCDLIEGKRPPGIFLVLDDICKTIHGQSDGVDDKFVQKLDSTISHPHYESRFPRFIVRHYAGDVTYDSDGFTDRNKDTLSNELLEILKNSSNQFISSLFPEPLQDPNDRKKKVPTAGKRIVKSAGELVTALMACTPHYIRCIKPNETKRPRDFNFERIQHQVRYLGLLENVRIRRAGFAYRQKFDRFLYRFAILSPQTWPAWSGDDRSGCMAIVNDMRVPQNEYQLGRTKMFLRSPETLFGLEEQRDRKFHDCAAHIQRAYRRWKSQKTFEDLKMSQVQLVCGRKERRRNSLERDFNGDYLGFKDNFLLNELVQANGGMNEQVMFADHVNKYDRRFKCQKRDILVSTGGLYIISIDQVKKGPQKGEWVYVCKRKIALQAVRAMTLSQLSDGFLAIHVNGEHDNLIESNRKIELICTLNWIMQGRLQVQYANSITYTLKNGKTKTVNFLKDPSLPDVAVKKFKVGVPQGMDPNSQPTPTYVAPDPSQRRQYGDGGGPTRPGARAAEVDPRLAFQQRNQAAGGIVRGARGGATMAQPSYGPSAGSTSGGGGGEQAKAIYDYSAQDGDELSFRVGDIITITEKLEGWNRGTLNGQSGLFPANYVEPFSGGGAPAPSRGRGGPRSRGRGGPRSRGGGRGRGGPVSRGRGRGRGRGGGSGRGRGRGRGARRPGPPRGGWR